MGAVDACYATELLANLFGERRRVLPSCCSGVIHDLTIGNPIFASGSDYTTQGDDVSREQEAEGAAMAAPSAPEFWRRLAMMWEIAARQLKKQGRDGSETGG